MTIFDHDVGDLDKAADATEARIAELTDDKNALDPSDTKGRAALDELIDGERDALAGIVALLRDVWT